MFQFSFQDPFFLPHSGCNVSITLNPGELTVVSGENGIGKSTLLEKMFRENQKFSSSLVPQKPLDIFFDRKISVFKDLLLKGSEKMNQNFFQKYWELSGLSRKEDRSLSQLSGGEAQILKLISICSTEANIYLLDEPGQYLDAEKKNLVSSMLNEMSQVGKTLFVVEHDAQWLSPKRSLRMYLEDSTLVVKE